MTRIGVTTMFAIALVAYPANAQMSNTGAAHTAGQVREWCQANEARVINEMVSLLAIPNVATDTQNIQRNAAKLVEMLHARGFSTQLLPTVQGRGPVVFGRLDTPGAKRTVIFYMHYDGQPVDPRRSSGSRGQDHSIPGGWPLRGRLALVRTVIGGR